jgi:hypothetical protein
VVVIMADFKMDDYVDVSERIVEFRTKHPEGSLQQVAIDFRDFAGTSWVIYTAAAYRAPDDLRPGHGTAWEPVPGRTPFTKGSELQNAETAAWGRAIVAALAADTKRGVASAQEVRNRYADQSASAAPDPLIMAKVRVWNLTEGRGDTEGRRAFLAAALEARGTTLDTATVDQLNALGDEWEQAS